MSTVKDFFPVINPCGYVTGDIGIFATQDAPEGFFECNGRSLEKDVYVGLYNILGDTYGSDATTFNIPDYRGLFLRGHEDGSGPGIQQTDTLANHTHNLPRGNSTSGSDAGLWDDASVDDNIALESYGQVETRPENIYVLFAIKY